MKLHSPNFSYLNNYSTQLVTQAVLTENYFAQDPSTCLIKLRQFGELLAQKVAARWEERLETLLEILRVEVLQVEVPHVEHYH